MARDCECCKGSGVQTLHVHEVTTTGTTHKTCEISCIWCNGTGTMTEEQIIERRDYVNAWCKCGDFRVPYNVNIGRTIDVKCRVCGGYIVIG